MGFPSRMALPVLVGLRRSLRQFHAAKKREVP
jgi:hypothetical protein